MWLEQACAVTLQIFRPLTASFLTREVPQNMVSLQSSCPPPNHKQKNLVSIECGARDCVRHFVCYLMIYQRSSMGGSFYFTVGTLRPSKDSLLAKAIELFVKLVCHPRSGCFQPAVLYCRSHESRGWGKRAACSRVNVGEGIPHLLNILPTSGEWISQGSPGNSTNKGCVCMYVSSVNIHAYHLSISIFYPSII